MRGPRAVDGAESHSAQRRARARVDHGEEEVPGEGRDPEQEERDVCEPREQRSRPQPEPGPTRAEPEREPGGRERVQLLAGVELSRGRELCAPERGGGLEREPAEIVARPAERQAEVAQRDPGAAREEDDGRQRRERDRRGAVDRREVDPRGGPEAEWLAEGEEAAGPGERQERGDEGPVEPARRLAEPLDPFRCRSSLGAPIIARRSRIKLKPACVKASFIYGRAASPSVGGAAYAAPAPWR
jgi:hypothetical protein